MNTKNTQPQKWFTKRLLRLVAFVGLAIGVACLLLCAKIFFEENFLDASSTINSGVVDGMKKMIKAGFFGIIPGISVLLIINSVLMWVSSNNIDFEHHKHGK